jgi:predicted ribosome quality control (RQC) complex YloA/Tae2 family protein
MSESKEGEDAGPQPLLLPSDPQWPITSVDIYVEIMGRLSNIVLVDNQGLILDAMKRIPPSLNRYRSTLPHQQYVEPPPQEKRDPMRASPNVLSVIMSELAATDVKAPAWKGLVEGFRGVSPTLAREAVYRAFEDTAIKADDIAGRPRELEKVLGTLSALLSEDLRESATTAWREGVGGNKEAIDFAPYRLTHLDTARSPFREGTSLIEHASTSEAIEAYYDAVGSEQLAGHAALKGQVRAELGELLAREERRLRALQEELARSRSLEMLRTKGEMVLAYMHTVEPGQTALRVQGSLQGEGEDFTIALDPALTPVENAQAYFREYRKAQSAQAGLPEKVSEAQSAVDFWDGLVTSLELAASYDDIRAVQEEMRAARRPPTLDQPQPKPGKGGSRDRSKNRQEKLPQPLRLRTHRGAHLLVGRTAGQNDTATFRLASPEDLWLHVRGAPGSHVILRVEGGYTEDDVEEAAQIAAGYSKLRTEQYVDVLVTERRNVRKVAGAPPGTATYKNERVLRVRPILPGAIEKEA